MVPGRVLERVRDAARKGANRFVVRSASRVAALFPALLACACESPTVRNLDPRHRSEVYRAELKLIYEPGVTDPALLGRIEAGDLLAFSGDDDKGGSATAFLTAASKLSHVALVYPFDKYRLRVISSDSEQGVYIDTLEKCVRGRNFYVFSFPPGLLDQKRIAIFAERAVHLGRLDYDWSGIFGFNSNLTPNSVQEVGDEYTCASCVAAALHYAGLSLDRAWKGVVTPGDVVFSPARRNLNGPGSEDPGAEGPGSKGTEEP